MISPMPSAPRTPPSQSRESLRRPAQFQSSSFAADSSSPSSANNPVRRGMSTNRTLNPARKNLPGPRRWIEVAVAPASALCQSFLNSRHLGSPIFAASNTSSGSIFTAHHLTLLGDRGLLAQLGAVDCLPLSRRTGSNDDPIVSTGACRSTFLLCPKLCRLRVAICFEITSATLLGLPVRRVRTLPLGMAGSRIRLIFRPQMPATVVWTTY